MRTPISYYGGKQNMIDIILPLLPAHRLYCEPFTGGAAVFFAKPPAPVEILNDLNPDIANFYEVLQRDFDALNAEVQASLHSRKLHRRARVIYKNPDMFDRVKRAWAVWYLANMSFGSDFNGGFGLDAEGKRTRVFTHKKAEFTAALSERLKNTRIESYDATKVIRDNDSESSLFYVDPPYVGADQGHYAGYTQNHFDALLQTLSEIKGKFLLSSYQNDALTLFTRKNNWYTLEIIMNNAMASSALGSYSAKTEVLTANYPLCKHGQSELFEKL